MWFHYRQNNSGASFHRNANLDVNVVIEADTATDADTKAKSLGIYFDGVAGGRDCRCCGDRWYRAYEANDQPSCYGDALDLANLDTETVIHHRDGRIQQNPARNPHRPRY